MPSTLSDSEAKYEAKYGKETKKGRMQRKEKARHPDSSREGAHQGMPARLLIEAALDLPLQKLRGLAYRTPA